MKEKIAQCRYCSNSSNECQGVWSDDAMEWICRPCFDMFEGNLTSERVP